MRKTFEDEFMEVQSDLISLCLEFLEITRLKANKIYVYCSVEEYSLSFNAFYDISGQIRTLDEMGVGYDLIKEFLSIGTNDLDKVQEVCQKHNVRHPTEIKMCYDVVTGKFDAKYQYHEICTENTDKDVSDVFFEWIAEVRGQ